MSEFEEMQKQYDECFAGNYTPDTLKFYCPICDDAHTVKKSSPDNKECLKKLLET